VIGGQYSGSFNLTTPGLNYVRYLSLDVLGNQEDPPKFVQVNIVSNKTPKAINLEAQGGVLPVPNPGSAQCCGKTYPPVTLKWEYSDDDNNPAGTDDPQTYYRVEVIDAVTGNVVIRSCDPTPSNPSNPSDPNARCQTSSNEVNFAFSPSPTAGYPTLSFNKDYSWRVKVWDTKGPAESDWYSGTFTTILHPFPSVDFDWYPKFPTKDEIVQLCSTWEEVYIAPCDPDPPETCGIKEICSDTSGDDYINRSKCYYYDFGTINSGYCNRSGVLLSWTLSSGAELINGPPAASFKNPKIKVTGTDATLTITDLDNYSCSVLKPIIHTLPLPKWKEILPF
jgi:hypothetical protein